MNYVDTYIKGSSQQEVASLCAYFRNVIGPLPGRAAFTYDEGTYHPAVGDPSKWYACIRAPFDLYGMLPNGVEFIDPVEGASVVGVWA